MLFKTDLCDNDFLPAEAFFGADLLGFVESESFSVCPEGALTGATVNINNK